MRSLIFLFIGILIGAWISWPGIIKHKKWECFFKLINSSKNEKISFKALLAISPQYLLKRESSRDLYNLRIVSDACFR